jgi:hypothetical protein
MNHFEDEKEDFEKTKLLCRFLNPQAAETIFDGKKVEITTSNRDVLFDTISKDLKGKYSAEELEQIMNDPKHYSELDHIERA